MAIALPAYKLNTSIASLLLVMFSLTDIALFQVQKAPITIFHLLLLPLSVLIILTAQKGLIIDKRLLWVAGYITVINIFNITTLRVSSYLYNLVVFFEFVIISSLFKRISIQYLKRAFALIILLYFLNMLVTWLLIQTNTYNEFGGTIFRAYWGMRPMGFSSEPSYASFIVAVAFVGLNEISYAEQGKNSWFFYVLFVASVALSTSAYGWVYVLMYTAVLLWRILSSLSAGIRYFIFSGLILGLVILIAVLAADETSPLRRVIRIASVMTSGMPLAEKLDEIGIEDASAWARVGPTWMLFNDGGDLRGILLGHGSGSAGAFFHEQLVGILISEDKEYVDLGIIPGFIYEFGLVGLSLLMIFIVHAVRRNRLFIAMLILFFFNAGINTQIIWFSLLVFSITSMIIVELRRANADRRQRFS